MAADLPRGAPPPGGPRPPSDPFYQKARAKDDKPDEIPRCACGRLYELCGGKDGSSTELVWPCWLFAVREYNGHYSAGGLEAGRKLGHHQTGTSLALSSDMRGLEYHIPHRCTVITNSRVFFDFIRDHRATIFIPVEEKGESIEDSVDPSVLLGYIMAATDRYKGLERFSAAAIDRTNVFE